MTIQGALTEIFIMLNDETMPIYFKPSLKKVAETIEAEQRMGHWIDDGQYADGHSQHAYRCSKCDESYIGYVGEYKYCPNCGCAMKGEFEDNGGK